MSQDQDVNIQKIRALFSKTVENGASESEAMSSIALAKKLMEKHGLSVDDIKNKNVKVEDFVWGTNSTKAQNYATTFENIVSNTISKYTNTKAVKCTGAYVKGKKASSRILFFGHKIDVELSVYMLNVCNDALKAEWAFYKSSTKEKLHGNKIKTFSIGMAIRIVERIEHLMENEIKYKGNELMVMKNQLVETLYSSFNIEEKQNAISKWDDDDSLYKGYMSGEKVELHRKADVSKTLKIEKE